MASTIGRGSSSSGSRAVSGIVVAWAVLLAIGLYAWHVGIRDAQEMLVTLRAAVGIWALVLLALAYAIALAMPFVPGMELGLLIMVAFGPAGVLAAYVATLAGLSMAYAAGRVLPQRFIPARLTSGDSAIGHQDIACAMPKIFSASRLGRSAPPRLVDLLLAHRYLALAICLNLPGNAVVGGGGGIALLCGLSRQFEWCRYLLTTAIATSPVPILVLTGVLNLHLAAD